MRIDTWLQKISSDSEDALRLFIAVSRDAVRRFNIPEAEEIPSILLSKWIRNDWEYLRKRRQDAHIRPLIITSAKYIAVDMIRRAEKVKFVELTTDPARISSDLNMPIPISKIRAIKRSSLELLLSIADGESVASAARRLKVHRSVIYTSLSRTRQRLRSLMGETG